MSHTPQVAVLGGGTGTFMMLLALKQLPVNITAILTMVDDGGSNRILRDQFGLLPSSGITQCIVALSENESMLRELVNYRFHQSEELSGMRFGNLLIAAITDIVGSQKQAIEETMKLLQVKGNILPISYDDVRLVAEYEDGSTIRGEHHIDEPDDAHDGTMKITNLTTDPTATLSDDARKAILAADYVIFGPGDFYTNTVANFVVEGVSEALQESQGKKIFFSNLMTKYGETYDYSLTTFLEEIEKYFTLDHLDYMVVNSNSDYPAEALAKYANQRAQPVADDIDGEVHQNVQIIRGDLIGDTVFGKSAGDVLQRSILRHDPDKVARLLQERIFATEEK